MNLEKLHKRWIALQVRTHWEGAVASVLSREGYQVSVPREPVCFNCSSNCRGAVLCPGYVLCRFDVQNPWSLVRTPGVTRLVSFGSNILPLDDAEVTGFLIAAASDRCRWSVRYSKAGEVITVTNGPLAGTAGIFVRTGRNGRIILSISMLNRSISLELDEADVVSHSPCIRETALHERAITNWPVRAVASPAKVLRG